ncbi:hypothetical protein ACHHV8_35540 [Paenibacillus sp. TAB 01]|uniref:hypothetical protein n=1 Tax=Paenibacillus sp. TAB 01 TaxID=3368988 RepID=UPI003752B31B
MEGRLRFEAALSLRARPLGAAWEVLQEFLGSRENALARYLLQGKISDQAAANSGQAFVVPSRPAAALLWRMPTTYSLNMERFMEGIMNRPVTNGSPVDSLARPGVSVPMLQRTLEALAAARLGMGHSAASAAHMPVQRAAQRGGSATTMWGQAQTPWLVASLGPAYMDAGGHFFLAERPSYPRWNALYSVQGLPAGQLAAKGSYLGSPSMPVEEQTPISPPIWRWGRQMGLWQHREVPNLGWNIPFIGLSPAGGGSLLRAVTLTQLQRSPGKEALWLYLAELEAAGAVTGGLTSSIRQSSAQHEGRSRISHQQQPYPDPSYGPAKERKAFLLNVLELNRPPSRGSWLSRFQRTDGEWNGWSDFEQAGSRARGEAETRKAQANANLYISLRGLRLQNRLNQPFNGSLPREPGRLWRLHPAEALEEMNPKGATATALGWRRLRDEGVEADRAAGQTGRPRPGVDYGGLTGSSPRTVQLHRQGPHVRKGIDSSALAAITDYITRLSRSIGLLSPRIHAGHIAAMNTGRDSDGNGNRRMAEVKAPLLQEVFRAWNGMNFPNAAKGWSHWGAGTEWIPVTPDSWNSRSLRNVHAAKMSDFGYLWSTWRDRSQGNALNSMHAMGFWNPWDTARNVRQDSGSGAEAWKVHAIRMTNGLIDLRQPAFRLWQERLSTQLLNLQPFGNRNDGSFRLSMTGEAGMNSQIREIWLTNRTAIYPDGRTNGQRGSEQVFGSRVSPAFDAILREAIIPLRQAGLAGSTATAGWPTNPYLPGLQYLRPAASFGVPGDWMQKTVYGFRNSMDANAEADRQLPVSAALSAYDRAVRTSLAQAANWLSSAIGQAAADSQIVSPSISGLRFPLAQEPKGTGGWSGSLQRAALIFHGQSLPAAAETLGTLRKVIQARGSGPLQEAQRLRQTSSPEKGAGVQRFIVWLQHAARQPIGTAVMGIDPGSHGRQGALPSTEDRHLIASGVNTVFVHMMLKRMQPEAQRSGATSSLTGSGLEHRAGHQDVLEHKRTPSVTPEESEWAQTPLDISWLKPAPAQAPAAAAVPAIQPAPQIELSQLEELIK